MFVKMESYCSGTSRVRVKQLSKNKYLMRGPRVEYDLGAPFDRKKQFFFFLHKVVVF